VGLSPAKVAELEEALLAIEDHYINRLNEIERQIRNLQSRGAKVSDLGEDTTEAGIDEAISIIESVGASVS